MAPVFTAFTTPTVSQWREMSIIKSKRRDFRPFLIDERPRHVSIIFKIVRGCCTGWSLYGLFSYFISILSAGHWKITKNLLSLATLAIFGFVRVEIRTMIETHARLQLLWVCYQTDRAVKQNKTIQNNFLEPYLMLRTRSVRTSFS